MTDKKIKVLAKESFFKNSLNQKKVKLIVKSLKRSELKEYIKALKLIEAKNTVFLTLSQRTKAEITEDILKNLKSQFPSKKIELVFDPTLIAGIKIVSDDLIYDFNVKNTLEEILSHIKEEDYD